MQIQEKEVGSVSVVAISGRLTADCADQFKKSMTDLISKHKKMILNLSEMEYIDSTGLGVLVYVLQKLNDENGILKLACMQPKPRVVFNITKAYKIFDIYDTVDAALGAVNA